MYSETPFVFNGEAYISTNVIGERAIEIPIVRPFLDRFNEDEYFEVGFVLPLRRKFLDHRPMSHLVIDKYEEHDDYENLRNIDIVDFVTEHKFSGCFSISTLEHVGLSKMRGFDPNKIVTALEVIRSALCDGGFLFVTLPFGYNRPMDAYIMDGKIAFDEMYFLKQVDKRIWEQVGMADAAGVKYGTPFPAANVLLIGVDGNE